MDEAVVIPITIFSAFLRRHGNQIGDRDWKNFQTGLKMLKRHAPSVWLSKHENLYADNDRRESVSAVSTPSRMATDAQILVTMLRGFLKGQKEDLGIKERHNLIVLIKIVRRYA